MTPNEYQELANFFIEKVEQTQAETRILVESLRDDIRVVADGVVANGRRIDENTRRLDENTRAIEVNGARIDVLSTGLDRLTHRVGDLEQTVATGFGDHEARLRKLERP